MNKQNQNQHRKNHHRQQQPQPQPQQKCPRCESTNTKFCYYNNYSLSQPRYFCKSCRRYWTQGGTLRNVPVGGSCRKGKRTKTATSLPSSLSSSSSSSLVLPSNPAPASGYNYPGAGNAGYLSSPFAAIQTSFNQPQSFSQALATASSTMNRLGSFGNILNYYGAVQPGRLYVNSNRSDHESLINQSGGNVRANSGPSSQHDRSWSRQNFDSVISTGASQSVVSNIGTESVQPSNANTFEPSLGPYQWSDLPRSYGSPPA